MWKERKNMKIRHVANIAKGHQDGAIWGNYLFCFNSKGLCRVYDLKEIGEVPQDLTVIATFTLDGAERVVPHSNAVVFGAEYYEEGDEFPLLYSNIYNNYAKVEDKMKGVCLVYRLQRAGTDFTTTLLGSVEIGFVEDERWSDGQDKRPYGNFVIDRENGIYHAFTMRDAENITRYFSFDLPKHSDAVADEQTGMERVILGLDKIRDSFDCDYHKYIQGACFHDGKVYSAEGFTNREDAPAAIRIINVATRRQEQLVNLFAMGYTVEPELIDFCGDTCYYSDVSGALYVIDF